MRTEGFTNAFFFSNRALSAANQMSPYGHRLWNLPLVCLVFSKYNLITSVLVLDPGKKCVVKFQIYSKDWALWNRLEHARFHVQPLSVVNLLMLWYRRAATQRLTDGVFWVWGGPAAALCLLRTWTAGWGGVLSHHFVSKSPWFNILPNTRKSP